MYLCNILEYVFHVRFEAKRINYNDKTKPENTDLEHFFWFQIENKMFVSF